MAIAAVPDYLGQDFSSASLGLRFGFYLQVWTEDFRKETSKVEPLKRAAKLTDRDCQLMSALVARQQAGFSALAEATVLQLPAIAIAPFSTGLGNEHPLENGFAFLNPYGLPYLPGSGVKGVLRQAARELASGEWDASAGWGEAEMTALFGLQSEDGAQQHQRGALTFWDVIPQIKGDSLSVEIMTPHQKHYYQDGQTPHDSGQPVPISFLTVPPGSGFTFHVQCDLALLARTAPALAERWKGLLQAAFSHAFAWLGFGAKTAVGYGAMLDVQAQAAEQEAARQQSLQDAGIQLGTERWSGAQLKEASPGSGEISITSADGSKTAKGCFYAALSEAAKKRFKKKKPVRLDVEVEIQGNHIIIKAVSDAAE